LVISRAKDQYVWDADGNQYLDFFGGIVTVSVGHCNDTVNAKLRAQMDTLQHVSTVFANEPQGRAGQEDRLDYAEGKLTKSFFTNSGTEANETAILAARCYTGSSEIVALRHSYHGRSALAMTLTAHSNWRLGGVPQAGIVHAHSAYCYRCPFGLTYPDCNIKCAQDVEDLIRTPRRAVSPASSRSRFKVSADSSRRRANTSASWQTSFADTAVFSSAMKCRQPGDAPAAKWFGIEQYGVTPDVITSAKGLGNGFRSGSP